MSMSTLKSTNYWRLLLIGAKIRLIKILKPFFFFFLEWHPRPFPVSAEGTQGELAGKRQKRDLIHF